MTPAEPTREGLELGADEQALARELEEALEALERSFHVHLIATFDPALECAPAAANAAEWLRNNHPSFDQFPVRDGDRTIGVLLRGTPHDGKPVREVMEPLREGLVVSSAMPIADLIPQLESAHYRLVLRGERIGGLVTQSDLLKLPVRMLVFGLASHLEACLRAVIRRRSSSSDWILRLDPARQEEVRQDIERLSRARLEPDPLEFTVMKDMESILVHESAFGRSFVRELREARLLRNDVAHGKTYIHPTSGVRPFVNRFETLRRLIEHTSTILLAPA